MIPTLLALVLASAAAQEPVTAVRAVAVSVLDKKDAPVLDLQASEITVIEDKQERKVLGIEPDTRPLEIAVVVDSSDGIGDDWRSTLVPALFEFWRALPETAKVSVWTCGGASVCAVPVGTPIAEAETKLKGMPAGGSNLALYALADAGKELAGRPGARRVLVAVVGSDVQAKPTTVQKMNEEIGRARAVPMLLLLQLMSGFRQGWDSESVFEGMVQGYGGWYRKALSSSAASKGFKQIGADLVSQYRVRYETVSPKPTHPEVKLSRKGLKARAGVSESSR
jgi:hypothetical protein